MARPKKQAPTRKNKQYEYKAVVGRNFDGTAIRKSFYSPKSIQDAKVKAQEYIIRQEVIAQTGATSIASRSSEMTLAKWATNWLEVYKKPTVSKNSYEYTYANAVNKHIIPYFGTAKLTDVKSADVQKFYNEKSQTLSESMMKKINLCMNGIFETAIDNDLIIKNPTKHVKFTSAVPPIQKRVFTEEQIETAKEFLKSDVFPAAYVILESGLRRGEFLGLMWSDFDYTQKTLSVNRSIARAPDGKVEVRPPKWNSYRTIPISTELANFIKKMPQTGDYIFGDNGNARSIDSFNSRFASSMQRLNSEFNEIPALTPHELRHTYGTHLRRIGVDIYTIQKIMGHKDINITANTYVHDETETTRKAAKII
ncbi:MAG: tyrosine-type recombinase/integrase [Oscillospiraceae bacterium]